jgi:hypothetical protein
MSSRLKLQRAWVCSCVLILLLPRCAGTEADNPFTDVIITPCKSSDEYEARSLEQLGPELSPAVAVPIGLQCLQWQVVDDVLELQILNFGAGCGIVWEGRATVDGERLSIALDNPSCVVAACFSCIYDAAVAVPLAVSGDMTLEFRLGSCASAPDVQTWDLPVAQQPRGMVCEYADTFGARAAAFELGMDGSAYSVCGELGADCDEGLTCNAVGELDARCLPPCSRDSDCPLDGATRCSEGLCVP